MAPLPNNQDELPLIYPLRFEQVLPSGTNKPLLVTGRDKNSGEEGEWVVKLRSSERMYAKAIINEIFAILLAKQLGIHSVKPGLANINEGFVELLRGSQVYQRAAYSKGLNFASEYLGGEITVLSDQPFSKQQEQEAWEVFLFDLMIQNPDRTQNKPNLLTNGKNIFILDHELAFSFLLNFFQKEAFRLDDYDKNNLVAKHVFFRHFSRKKKLPENAYCLDKLDSIDNQFWESLKESIPPELWNESDYDDNFETIKRHFAELANNREAFLANVKACLQ